MFGKMIPSKQPRSTVLLTAVLVMTIATAAIADEEEEKKVLEIGKWYPAAEAGINLTQSAYSDNWAGGDKGSVVWTFIFNGGLENQLNQKVNWNNVLKLAYGQTHQQVDDGEGDRHWAKPEKSTDLIDFETIFRFTQGWFVDPYVAGRFESYFQDATDPDGRSLSLNPMIFKESVGVAHKFIDEEDRSLLSRFGISFRQSRRRFFQGPPPETETGSVTANDAGLEWITNYKTKVLSDRVAWNSKLSLYKAFTYSGNDIFDQLTEDQLITAGLEAGISDFTTALDADWENIFTTQITKAISVNLYTRWIYDKYDNSVKPVLDDAGELSNADVLQTAVRKAGQFKYTMSIGIIYRFI